MRNNPLTPTLSLREREPKIGRMDDQPGFSWSNQSVLNCALIARSRFWIQPL